MEAERTRSDHPRGTVVLVAALLCAVTVVALPCYSTDTDPAHLNEFDRARQSAGRQLLMTTPLTETGDDRRHSLASSKRRRLRSASQPANTGASAATAHEWAGRGIPEDIGATGRQHDAAAKNTAPVPDGYLVSWRRHANGCVAAVVGHYDGTLTARPWPQRQPFVTGLRDLADARAQADHLAHALCAGTDCGTWRSA